MKPFVDTNVILEQILKRRRFKIARELFRELAIQDMDICVSYLTMANMAYVLRKGRKKEQLHETLKEIQECVKIFNCTERQWKRATGYGIVKDFEDLLQYMCAKDHKCDAIITFNKKDFKFSTDIYIYTPQEYLDFMKSNNKPINLNRPETT